jgi:hypothetical protein
MSFTDTPEFIASRLTCEIRESESRLNTRIHELEMKLSRGGLCHRIDLSELMVMATPWLVTFALVIFACLAGRSHDSNNTEPNSQTTHAEPPVPQAIPHSQEPR